MRAIIVAFAMILYGYQASAQTVSAEDIEKFRREKECANRYQDSTARYVTMADTWFTKPASKFHIVSNYNVLVRHHSDYLTLVRRFQEQSMPRPDDSESLIEALKALDAVQTDILNRYSAIAAMEEGFVRGLGAIDSGLLEVGEEFQYIADNCPLVSAESINQAQKTMTLWRRELARARDYIAQSSAKRRNLFKVAWTSRRVALIKQHAAATDRSLAQLQGEIDAALALDQLYNEFNRWWHQAVVVPGIAGGLGFRYLQYHAALRELTIDIAEVEEFVKRLQETAGGSSDARAIVASDMATKKSRLTAERDRLQSLGWQGQYEKQLALTARRQQIADRYSQSCRDVIEQYQALASDSLTQAGFQELEAIYMRQVDLCSTGDAQ